jgi:hypothetical protein
MSRAESLQHAVAILCAPFSGETKVSKMAGGWDRLVSSALESITWSTAPGMM